LRIEALVCERGEDADPVGRVEEHEIQLRLDGLLEVAGQDALRLLLESVPGAQGAVGVREEGDAELDFLLGVGQDQRLHSFTRSRTLLVAPTLGYGDL